jgi:hypothetical protein
MGRLRRSVAWALALGLLFCWPLFEASGQDKTAGALPDDVDAFNKPSPAELAARRLLGMGFNAIRVKDYANAEKLLLRARRIEPTNPFVLLNLGVVFHNTNRPKLAKEMWTRVANAPIASSTKAVITSDPDMVGNSPADVARRNLELLQEPSSKGQLPN